MVHPNFEPYNETDEDENTEDEEMNYKYDDEDEDTCMSNILTRTTIQLKSVLFLDCERLHICSRYFLIKSGIEYIIENIDKKIKGALLEN